MTAAATVKFLFFTIIILAVSFESMGDVFFKKWSLSGSGGILALGLLMYFIGTIFWAISLKYEALSRAVSVFFILSVILVTILGVVLFHEQLSLLNKIGIALGIVSLVLIEW